MKPARYVHGVYVKTGTGGAIVANCKDPITNNSELRIVRNPMRPFCKTKQLFHNFSLTMEYAPQH